MPFLPPSFYGQPLLNNNYTLQPPPQKKINPPQVAAFRNSYPGSTGSEVLISSNRNSEPRQLPPTPQYQTNPMFQFNVPLLQPSFQNENIKLQNDAQLVAQYQASQQSTSLQQPQHVASGVQRISPSNSQYQLQNSKQIQPQNVSNTGQNQSIANLQILQNHQREKSPLTDTGRFIKPLPQVGTLTTTDADGRLRVIVPVPSDGADDAGDILANLKLGNTLRPSNGPAITRSTSERVPNRSELMSQVQRTIWARHTTK